MIANRHAQLRRFKVLMQGVIADLQAPAAMENLYGFRHWLMTEINSLAEALGWCPHGAGASDLQMPFWRRGDVGLTVFDIDGGSWNGAIFVPDPSDEFKRECGG